MIIQRILNNNVVIIFDEDGEERVVCGKGIAFKKKIGDEIQEDLVNKIFILYNQDVNKKFQDILTDIPLEHIKIADEIVKYAKIQLGTELNDMILISLSDHIYQAMERFLEGICLSNELLWEIKRFYEVEYKIGCKALDMIEEKFKIRFPEDEAGSIALHIVNAEIKDNDMTNMFEITKIIREISDIVKYYFAIEFNTSSVYYYRFITHLKFFVKRVISGKQNETDEADDSLYDIVKEKYNNSYACIEKISGFIERKHHYVLTKEEKLYLMIHIERVVCKTRAE